MILKESQLRKIITKTVKKVLKEASMKKDWDWDESYVNYGENIPWEVKRKHIISAMKRSIPFSIENPTDISINKYGSIAFLSPFTSDCKEYLYTVKPEEMQKVMEELKNINDGYDFSQKNNGTFAYEKQHNGFWF